MSGMALMQRRSWLSACTSISSNLTRGRSCSKNLASSLSELLEAARSTRPYRLPELQTEPLGADPEPLLVFLKLFLRLILECMLRSGAVFAVGDKEGAAAAARNIGTSGELGNHASSAAVYAPMPPMPVPIEVDKNSSRHADAHHGSKFPCQGPMKSAWMCNMNRSTSSTIPTKMTGAADGSSCIRETYSMIHFTSLQNELVVDSSQPSPSTMPCWRNTAFIS